MTRAFKSLLALTAGGAAAVACSDSPFEPRGVGERISAGVVVTGSVASDTVRRYTFHAEAGREYAVFVDALDGSVLLGVYDSATHAPRAVGFDHAGTGGLYETATNNFLGLEGVLLIEVRRDLGSTATTALFQFLVYQVNTSPEGHSAEFAIGDTVTGERLEPFVDVDHFVAAGHAGQEVVGWLEALATGVGDLRLTVLSPDSQYLASAASVRSGGPAYVLPTQPFALPADGDYGFEVRAGRGSGAPFTGPYRFWIRAINLAPEHGSPLAPLGTPIDGEKIDEYADVDEFRFSGTAGQELNVFVQALSSSARVEVKDFGGGVLAAAASSSSDTGLTDHGTGRFRLPAAGTYTLRVTAGLSLADTGAYRLLLYPIDRRPEHVPATVVIGDTVAGESVDLPGDVDEFAFTGPQGQQVNVFYQALGGPGAAVLRLELVSPTDSTLRAAVSFGADTTLLYRQTGRVTLPATGTYTIRVSGVLDGLGRDRGPYRFFVYPVNTKPESLPDTLAFGDSVFGESIAIAGDLDEFRVTAPDSSGANLVLQVGPDANGGTLTAELVNNASGTIVTQLFAYTPGSADLSGTLFLAPGVYTVRVQGYGAADGPSLAVGSYRLWFYKFRAGPESVRDTIAVGDTVTGEAIDPVGDIDRFVFHGERGQHVNIALQGIAAANTGALQAFLSRSGQGFPLALVGTTTAADSLGAHQTLRLDLPSTGWYYLGVGTAGSPKAGFGDHGPYRLALTSQEIAPEHAGSALTPGDSVTTDGIDYLGDWDEFTATATAGRELGIIFESGATGPGYPFVRAFDPATGDTLAGTVGQGARLAGPFVVPSSGQVAIAVFEPPTVSFRMCYDATCNGVFRFVGGYKVRVIPIDRAPENVPAAYTVGDTVRGEALAPAGDIDEFTSSGTPGDTLSPWYHLTADPVPVGGLITLEVIDPTTGAVLVGKNVSAGYAWDFFSPGSFVVPPSGAFMIRVRGSGTFGDELATAPYEFFVKRGP